MLPPCSAACARQQGPCAPRLCRRLYFGESNVEGMLNTLLPLHEMMRKQGPTTLKEIAFSQASPDCLAHRTPA